MEVKPKIQQEFSAASLKRANAYCPHSNSQVGAAFKTKEPDTLFCGCNVENTSFGATICAERTAVFPAVASLDKPDFEYLVLVIEKTPLDVPCGLCLQVIAEFCDPDFSIYLANTQAVKEKILLKELMLRSFTL